MIRLVAHLFGWHTNACRGRLACTPKWGGRVTRRGWHR